MLKRIKSDLFHYINGVKVQGSNSNLLRGDCSNLQGNLDLIVNRPANLAEYGET